MRRIEMRDRIKLFRFILAVAGVISRTTGHAVELELTGRRLGLGPEGGQVCLSQVQPAGESVCTYVSDFNEIVRITVDATKLGPSAVVQLYGQMINGEHSATKVTMKTVLEHSTGKLSLVDGSAAACSMRVLDVQDAIRRVIYNQSLAVKLEISGCTIGPDRVLEVQELKAKRSPLRIFQEGGHCEGQGESKRCILTFGLSDLVPGTHAISFRIVNEFGVPVQLAGEVLHVSAMFNALPKEIQKSDPAGRRSFRALPGDLQDKFDFKRPCRVVIVGNTELDGQKRMWLDVLKSLASQANHFEATFLGFLNKKTFVEGPMYPALMKSGAAVDVVELQVTGDHSFASTEQLEKSAILAMEYLLRFPAFASIRKRCLTAIDASPPTCPSAIATVARLFLPKGLAEIILLMVGHLHGADIVIFGNSREISDVVLSRAAQLAGVSAVVVELPNHHPSIHLEPTVLVAPSWYTLDHPSVQRVSCAHKIVLYPGIDLERFTFVPREHRFASGRNAVTIGFMARLEPEKLPGLFLSLAEELVQRNPSVEFKFVVIGTGSLADTLERISRSRGIPVEYRGYLDSEGIVEEIKSHDLHVHLGFRETFCLANVEAMARGIPIVGFAATAVSDYMVHGVNSWVARNASLEGLVEAAEVALASHSESVRRSTSNSVQRFSLPAMLLAYQRLFLELAGFTSESKQQNPSCVL